MENIKKKKKLWSVSYVPEGPTMRKSELSVCMSSCVYSMQESEMENLIAV